MFRSCLSDQLTNANENPIHEDKKKEQFLKSDAECKRMIERKQRTRDFDHCKNDHVKNTFEYC